MPDSDGAGGFPGRRAPLREYKAEDVVVAATAGQSAYLAGLGRRARALQPEPCAAALRRIQSVPAVTDLMLNVVIYQRAHGVPRNASSVVAVAGGVLAWFARLSTGALADRIIRRKIQRLTSRPGNGGLGESANRAFVCCHWHSASGGNCEVAARIADRSSGHLVSGQSA